MSKGRRDNSKFRKLESEKQALGEKLENMKRSLYNSQMGLRL